MFLQYQTWKDSAFFSALSVLQCNSGKPYKSHWVNMCNVTKTGLRHNLSPWVFSIFFQSSRSVKHMQTSASDFYMLSLSSIDQFCFIFFKELLFTGIQKKSFSENFQGKVHKKSVFLMNLQATWSHIATLL